VKIVSDKHLGHGVGVGADAGVDADASLFFLLCFCE
jgi:hypothetical protein